MSANAVLRTGAVVAATVDLGTLTAISAEEEWAVPHYVMRAPMAAVYKGGLLSYSAIVDPCGSTLVTYAASTLQNSEADVDALNAAIKSDAALVIKGPLIAGSVRTGRSPDRDKYVTIQSATVAAFASRISAVAQAGEPTSLGSFLLSHFACACSQGRMRTTDDPSVFFYDEGALAASVDLLDASLTQAFTSALSGTETLSAVIAALSHASECMEVEPGDYTLDLSQTWLPQVALKTTMTITFEYIAYGDDRSLTVMDIPIMLLLTK